MNVQEQGRVERRDIGELIREVKSVVGPRLLLVLAAGMIAVSVLTYIAAHLLVKPMLLRFAAHNGLRSVVGSVESGGDPATFGLRLSANSSVLDVGWDALSPIIQAAQSGKLIISDGPVNREVQLSRDQLQNGRLIYGRPVSGDFMLTLEVMDSKSHGLAESVRVTGASFAGLSLPYRRQGSTVSTPALDSQPDHRVLGPAEHPASYLQSGDPAAVLKGHDLFPRGAGRAAAERRIVQSVAKPIAASFSNITGPAAPLANPLAGEPYATTIPVTSGAKLLTPATVLSPYYPDIHPGSGPTLETNLFISVKVKINEAGEVTSAALAQQDPSAPPYYVDEALKAARSWRFSPAMVSGRPVASEMEIQFHFSPAP